MLGNGARAETERSSRPGAAATRSALSAMSRLTARRSAITPMGSSLIFRSKTATAHLLSCRKYLRRRFPRWRRLLHNKKSRSLLNGIFICEVRTVQPLFFLGCHLDRHSPAHIAKQLDRDLEVAYLLDRLGQRNLAPVDLQP